MIEFEKWDNEFRAGNMNAFNDSPEGLMWLKVRAITRRELISKFTDDNDIILCSTKVSEQSVELFDILKNRRDAMQMLDKFLHDRNNEWYSRMGVNIGQLKEDLYQVQYYTWGGDQNNSLDKYYIRRYVKVISNYSALLASQTEIGVNAWNYVQNSWYNNWTSFLIESLFKCNPRVISAVGEIKSVDFFIGNYPFDLKVTFFPSQFMEGKLQELLGKKPLAWLKRKCKEVEITCDLKSSESQQFYTLIEKLKEIDRTEIIEELNSARRKIIKAAQDNPMELIKWLYENQGEMRFGSENRIYLVLADSSDPSQSWKMKRQISLIEPIVSRYLSEFSHEDLKTVHFEYKKKIYTTISDILFVIK